MAIDTIKLKSPTISEALAVFLEGQCVLKSGLDLKSGEMLYEITTGSLVGSYDSRISFRVMRDDWVNIKGRCELIPCDPFILLECSAPKALHGQNVYGALCDFPQVARLVLMTVECLFNPDADPNYELPSAKFWEVRRVDWAEMFDIHPEGIAEYFRALKKARFPRRIGKSSQHGEHSLHFPGEMTTLRFYHKGPEFKDHDLKRISRMLPLIAYGRFPNWSENERVNWIYKKISMEKRPDGQFKGSLLRLAYRRLRVEVQVNAPKLKYDFNDRFPLVDEVTDEYLISVYENEVNKILHEGKTEMETVRTHEAVRARLLNVYGKTKGKNLLSFWMRLAAEGEDLIRIDYSKSRFYEYRKLLSEAGVSWFKSDIQILPNQTFLPSNFKPFRQDSRLCVLPIRWNSAIKVHPADMFDLIEFNKTRRVANVEFQRVAA